MQSHFSTEGGSVVKGVFLPSCLSSVSTKKKPTVIAVCWYCTCLLWCVNITSAICPPVLVLDFLYVWNHISVAVRVLCLQQGLGCALLSMYTYGVKWNGSTGQCQQLYSVSERRHHLLYDEGLWCAMCWVWNWVGVKLCCFIRGKALVLCLLKYMCASGQWQNMWSESEVSESLK